MGRLTLCGPPLALTVMCVFLSISCAAARRCLLFLLPSARRRFGTMGLHVAMGYVYHVCLARHVNMCSCVPAIFYCV